MNIIPFTKLLISARQLSDGVRNATGLVENWESVINTEAIENLQRLHNGLFCFLAFNSVVDKEIFDYIESGALAAESGDKLLILYVVNCRMPSASIVTSQELSSLLTIRNDSNPCMEIISKIFDNKFHPVLPALVIYDNLVSSKSAIYIPLNNKQNLSKVDCLRFIVKVIQDKSLRNIDKEQSSINKLSTAFTIANLSFEKNINYTFGECMIKTFQTIVKFKSDLISIFV
ncbi:hypothetical protein [Spirosoma jeollabukense]